MDSFINITRKQLLPLIVTVSLITFLIIIAKSSYFLATPRILSIGITLDLMLTVPLVYFLLIRKKAISRGAVSIVFAVCLFISFKIIPSKHQLVLPLLQTWLLPIAEIAIIGYILIKLRKARHNYQLKKTEHIDFHAAIKQVAGDILPNSIARILATEISVLYYGLAHWNRRSLEDEEFSNHKKSTSISIFWGIMLIISVETIVFHSILEQGGNSNVWPVTCLSIYSLLQILGFLKSLIKRPITFGSDQLFLRYGIMKETIIDLNNISSIALSSKALEDKMSYLSIFGKLESHNVIVYLKTEETLYGLYGIKKNYLTISFYVDEPQLFFNKACETIEQLKNK